MSILYVKHQKHEVLIFMIENIIDHKKAFDDIIQKYDLAQDHLASEIADFLMVQQNGNVISAQDFATRFGMSDSEAVIFLSFISRGLQFKKDQIDPVEE